ncbi:synaptobrevin homolog YKT6 isoform X1 [Octopus sinensis]|uniref:Synaptobrevin homolog YKT6 isoform X1 n=1 Tax=Octopus sinensis TaxID=2607531 RepID=A0A7E6FBE1_9MOLL|nr:synaptobrevin homolog YKT6 isoform X1 [Octopus sinensis]XP_036365069.1 synaptobrevin homolog YKT6 isoform X1 [Octopus sinensis]
MKVYALSILYKGETKARLLKGSYELSSFGYFQRSTVKEFMEFTSRIIVERSKPFSRSSVKEQDYLCHVYLRGDSLACVMIADHEYPQRVAHTLLSKVLDDFKLAVPPEKWPTVVESEVNFPQCDQYLKQSQNPQESDAMTKIQNDLDETKIILHNTIDAILERGEKLDDLVEKSEGLSTQSKSFYKTVKPREPTPLPASVEEPLVKTQRPHLAGYSVRGHAARKDANTGRANSRSLCGKCSCQAASRFLRAARDSIARKTNQCCTLL